MTNLTAMVWSPKVGGETYSNSSVYADMIDSSDFLILDTDKNNVLDMNDDPYSPYYPGDEYVDW